MVPLTGWDEALIRAPSRRPGLSPDLR